MNFEPFLPSFDQSIDWLASDSVQVVVRTSSALLLGFIGIKVVTRIVRGIVRRNSDEHSAVVVGRLLCFDLSSLLLLTALQTAGWDLTALLGAAGVLSLAFGLAAQTGLSNVISGFFLLWERPFKIGDLIEVDGVTGVVQSIDLTSTNLRKLDNIFVRIPNENLVKATVLNITRNPIRRMDFTIGVAYKEDPQRVMAILQEVGQANPLVLAEPEPLVLFQTFGDSAQEFLFGIWFEKSTYVAVRNSMLSEIKARFEAEGVEIPFPYRSLVAGSGDPIRIELTGHS